ncbi:hypothetical protein SPRG_05786 [Saprolegnia parasitica CBS 223.65]|uniref:N-acetyltransferase domain-containing protein n=1 Tax=Saprolegnia parasitica (strain CBS 223.65) TaxID=695850 RepID=A0A067CI94_SAPPC|nr:hypothetical protein SPRG_05786 [Saprolegnia parasitica CBS 223.65]KDO28915.1 hypothetical protein SPRG_05786 [Saprolegnia parasitica CBS 223.65]|eukprot:XP_012200458.1 hypothetical protein SPRG_05786 [Saprolegnia parasitica CBS 223.65]
MELVPASRLTASQAAQLLELVTISMQDEPPMMALDPDSAAQRYVITKWLTEKRLSANVAASYVYLDDDGRIIAHGILGFFFAPYYIGWAAFRRLQVLMSDLHDAGPDAYKLQALAVDPTRRGQGIGTRFVQSLLHEALPAGATVQLFTQVDRNVSFYEKLGFCTVATATTTVEDYAFPNYVMTATP